MERIYFDWAAAAIPSIDLLQCSDDVIPFGNPSSKHAEGRSALKALEAARASCAHSLNVSPDTIYFTSGGTESNAIVLNSPKDNIVTAKTEHPSIFENCLQLQKNNFTLKFLSLNNCGAASEESLKKVLSKIEKRTFVTLMSVNNETGTISDIPHLVKVCRESGKRVFFHTDIVQSAGKIHVDLTEWDVDAATLSAHKIGGPRGIGILYLKKPIAQLYRGGGQEQGMRSGTQNVAGAIAMSKCLLKMTDHLDENLQAAHRRMSYLIENLIKLERVAIIPQSRQNSSRFSPYILQTALKNIPAEVTQRLLDDAGFAVSTGSACSSGSGKRPVLSAMGIDDKTAFEGIRISQGWSSTDDHIEKLLCAIKNILKKY
ncbi:MAG: cysteine desulfurase family protein [Termitinemataceae bacterium]|nr:MAG: cysteine desulfurase family protein [Termitinemataceae bacterium]